MSSKWLKLIITCIILIFPFTVIAQVSVNVSDINFGSVNVLSPVPTDSTTQVTVTALAGTFYQISLSTGLSGTFAIRRMIDASSNYLNYNLYIDATFTMILGDGTGGTLTQNGTGSGAGQMYTVYGRIPTGQTVPTGIYSDTIIVTVTY